VKQPDSKTRSISRPAAALLAIYLVGMVCRILVFVFAEWSFYGAVVTVGTVVVVTAGLVALVVDATRRHGRNIGV